MVFSGSREFVLIEGGRVPCNRRIASFMLFHQRQTLHSRMGFFLDHSTIHHAALWCRSLPCLLLVVVVPLMAIPRSYSDPGPNPREQDDDAAVRVPPLPLSEPARPMRDPPWTPAEERNDPNTRHMAAGVAVALRLLMRNHAALGPIPDAFDEHRSARARVPLPFAEQRSHVSPPAPVGSHDLCAIVRLPRAPPLRWGSAGVRHFGLRIPRQSTARRRSHTRTARKSPPIQRSRIGPRRRCTRWCARWWCLWTCPLPTS